MAVNKFIGIGNLGRDPELRYMGDGKAVCNFSFAITEKYKDKSGDQKEVTEWINVATFGRLAEICGEYVRKGTKVYVEGKLKTEKYTDKNGIEKSATKITAEKVDILSSKGEAVTTAIKEATPPIQEFANDDDIPF
jgi:single-strand DNA-binding protein|tara:strand:- start:1712 stop:2119 length:408 start_codon:yes stop_codon:yes gene_type:complete